MENYLKWFDEQSKIIRVLLSIVGVPALLYRLFTVIIEKAKVTDHLVYLILNVVPIVGTIILIFDIVATARGRRLPLAFSEMTNPADLGGKEDAVEVEAEDKPEEKPEEPKEEPKEEEKPEEK